MTCGSIRSTVRLTYGERVGFMADELREIVRLLKRHRVIDCAAVEEYRYQGQRSHSMASFAMSELVGRLKQTLIDSELALVEGIDKNLANRALGLTGEVSARRIREAVKRMVPPLFRAGSICSIKDAPTNSHEYDAVLVAVAADQRVGRSGRKAR